MSNPERTSMWTRRNSPTGQIKPGESVRNGQRSGDARRPRPDEAQPPSDSTPRTAADYLDERGKMIDWYKRLTVAEDIALRVLIDHARATVPAPPVHLDDEDFGRFGDPIPCGAPVAHDEQGTPTAWCKRPTVPGHRCDLRVASTSRNALRGRLYAAFIGAEICRVGFGLLDRYRRPDAPEAERMADVALAAFRDAAHPEPEVVTGEEADELPAGSIVVSDYTEHDDSRNGYRLPYIAFPLTKTPEGFRYHRADKRPGQLMASRRFRVLYRAPETPAPASPTAIGDVIEDEAALDRLPDGTALRGHDGRVLQKARFSADEVLWEPGDDVALDCHLALPARVIDLPAPEQPTDSTGGAL